MVSRVFRYFEVIMVLAYLGFGVFILFFSKNILELKDFQRIGLGVVLIIYGTYRSYRAYKKNFINNEKENEEFQD
jgi:hypothetical protein